MKSINIYDLNKDFDAAREFAESFLKKHNTADVVIDETMLVLEALLYGIFENDEDYVHSNTSTGYVMLRGVNRLGETALKISFEGKRFINEDEDVDLAYMTPEGRILRAYAERIDYSFHTGLNRISIVTKRSSFRRAIMNFVAVILGIVIYLLSIQMMDGATQKLFIENIVFPIETILGNAVLMVGAPVTFLSLLKNLTDTYILSERNHGISRLRRSIVGSSVVSSLLAILCAGVIIELGKAMATRPEKMADMSVRMSVKELLLSLMPSDVFTPFQTISPFPLIFLAILVIYSFVSVGKYFDKLKDAIDAAYELFSRMLGIVLFTTPVFTFFATLDLLMAYNALNFMVLMLLCISVSMLVPIIYNLLRVKVAGIELEPFINKLIPLIKENMKMTSAIDAAPYNIRYCAKNYKLDRDWLEHAMPMLAQINRDGNCFLVTLVSIIIAMFGNQATSFFDIAVITFLVFFLSYGSPNQPGSMLIGVTIILIYADSFSFLAIAILAEVVFGNAVGIINIIGDIVTVVIDAKPKKPLPGKQE